MSFWKRKKQTSEQGLSPDDAVQVQKAKKKIKRSPPLAKGVKILAIETLESGLSAQEVGELVGVGSGKASVEGISVGPRSFWSSITLVLPAEDWVTDSLAR
jgi:hypothetical protein